MKTVAQLIRQDADRLSQINEGPKWDKFKRGVGATALAGSMLTGQPAHAQTTDPTIQSIGDLLGKPLPSQGMIDVATEAMRKEQADIGALTRSFVDVPPDKERDYAYVRGATLQRSALTQKAAALAKNLPLDTSTHYPMVRGALVNRTEPSAFSIPYMTDDEWQQYLHNVRTLDRTRLGFTIGLVREYAPTTVGLERQWEERLNLLDQMLKR